MLFRSAVMALTLVLLPVVAGAADQARKAGTLILNTGTREPFTTADHQGFLDLIVAELFHRIGIEAQVQVYEASARSLENSNSGIDDGEAMRIAGLSARFANLVQVPEKLIDNDFVAYALRDDVRVAGFADLAPYVVGYIIGWQIFERNLPRDIRQTAVKGADQLMEMLAADRVDVVLYERWQGLWRGKAMGLKLKVQEPPLAGTEMYMYLNSKHAALAPQVAAALAEMKRDGTYRRIVERTLIRLTRQ